MPKQATKACGNMYYEARIRAAKYNEKLLTRAGAISFLPGVTEESLKRYELGITKPPEDVVALMADAYNEPRLRSWYCVNECPLGRDCREIPDMPAEKALIRLQNSFSEAKQLLRQISLLMEEDTITEKEQPIVTQMRNRLLEFRRRTDENLVALERAEKLGKFD